MCLVLAFGGSGVHLGSFDNDKVGREVHTLRESCRGTSIGREVLEEINNKWLNR